MPRWRAATLAIIAATSGAFVALPVARSGAAVATRRGPFIGGDLHSLVVSPTDPSRIYVGGHNAVAASSNSGRRWRSVRSLAGADAMGWGFTEETVWVSGHPGLNRSDDAGRTFRRTNAGLPNTDVHAFGVGTSVLYGASPAVGVFASTDDGLTWQVRTNAAGRSFFGRIVVDPADAEHLLAADAQNGPVESRDGGRNWRRLGGLPAAAWLSGSSDLSLVVASGPAGIAQSRDGGATWSPLRTPKRALLVEADPDEPGVLYAATNINGRARLWTSDDGGFAWSRT